MENKADNPSVADTTGGEPPAPEQESRAAGQFACLARSARASASAGNLEDALAQIADAALEGLGWDSASVHIFDAGGNLVLALVRGMSASPNLAGDPHRRSADLMKRLLKVERPMFLESVSDTDAAALGIGVEHPARVAVAPILVGEQPCGILAVGTRDSSLTHPDGLPFLAALAAQSGEAIAHCSLRASYQQVRAGLEAAQEISKTATESLDSIQALDSILLSIRGIMQATACAVYEATDGQKRLRCVASLNVPQQLIQAVEAHGAGIPLRSVMKAGAFSDPSKPGGYVSDPRVAQAALSGRMRGALILPTSVGGQVYGALAVYDAKPRDWTETETRMAHLLSTIVVGAIGRARSYESVVQSASRLQELHRVSVRLMESGETKQVAFTATELGRHLLKADVVAIQTYAPRYQVLQLASIHPPDAECAPAVSTLDRGVFGKAVQEMRTLVKPLRLVRADFDGFVAALPLKSQDHLIGVLAVFRKAENGTFARDEIGFMELFAAIVATAMHNAQLMGRSEELGILTERTRIATEMHDSVGDNLAALLMKAELAQSALDTDPGRAHRELDWMIATLQQSIVDMRRILRALRPVELERKGLLASIRKAVDDFTHSCGIPVNLRLGDSVPSLGRKADYALYRAVNECLNNVRKHAGASTVTVALKTESERFRLIVEDNGRGFDPSGSASRQGMGLQGLRENAVAAGGELEIVSAPGDGTRITISFPIHESAGR
jgi:signal transduction histidine kinase